MGDENGHARLSHLLFAWSPAGYTLRELDGPPPRVGEQVEADGRTHVISKVGVSPFPGDRRLCAYTSGI